MCPRRAWLARGLSAFAPVRTPAGRSRPEFRFVARDAARAWTPPCQRRCSPPTRKTGEIVPSAKCERNVLWGRAVCPLVHVDGRLVERRQSCLADDVTPLSNILVAVDVHRAIRIPQFSGRHAC